MEAVQYNNYAGESGPMIRPIITLRKKRILIDIDTQKDLFLADGKACIRNHRRVLGNIRRVMAWTRHDHVRVISTIRVDVENGHDYHYCLPGTEGIDKIPYTVRNKNILFDSSDSTDLPRDMLRKFDQIVVCKRTDDPFDEPRIERLLSEANASEFVVIGGPAESSVLYTVLGLLTRRKNVTVLLDTLGSHEKSAAEIAIRKMQAKGAKLSDTKSLLGTSHLRLIHACQCERCQGRLQGTTLSA